MIHDLRFELEGTGTHDLFFTKVCYLNGERETPSYHFGGVRDKFLFAEQGYIVKTWFYPSDLEIKWSPQGEAELYLWLNCPEELRQWLHPMEAVGAAWCDAHQCGEIVEHRVDYAVQRFIENGRQLQNSKRSKDIGDLFERAGFYLGDNSPEQYVIRPDGQLVCVDYAYVGGLAAQVPLE